MIDEFNFKQQKHYQQVYKFVDELLFNEWDPIGVNVDGEGPRDEYSNYAGRIVLLLFNNRPHHEISDALYRIILEEIGLDGKKDEIMTHCKDITTQILVGHNEIISRKK